MYLVEKSHRNSQKRFYGHDKIYYIVTKTQNNFPYFKEPIFCELLIEELKICQELKKFKLYSFSLIYDHLNLLIQTNEKYNISKIMQSIKKETSRDINRIIGIDNNDITGGGKIPYNGYIRNKNNNSHDGDNRHGGDIAECRLQEYSADRLRMMEMIAEWQKMFIIKFGRPQFDMPGFKWQRSFHDHVIRDEKDYINHLAYTSLNYVKHGLPDDWKYTADNYLDMIDCLEL